MELELWKDIGVVKGVDYTGYYQISNQGNIRSLDRYVKSGFGSVRLVKGRQLTHFTIQKRPNYYVEIVNLNKESKIKAFIVARLVGIHFIPNPDNKPFINHIDSNSLNNFDWNLEWATDEENLIHSMKYGFRQNECKYDVNEMIKDYNKGFMMRELGEKYGVCRERAGAIIRKTGIKLRTRSESLLIAKNRINGGIN
jgi:hypothetical protein